MGSYQEWIKKYTFSYKGYLIKGSTVYSPDGEAECIFHSPCGSSPEEVRKAGENIIDVIVRRQAENWE